MRNNCQKKNENTWGQKWPKTTSKNQLMEIERVSVVIKDQILRSHLPFICGRVFSYTFFIRVLVFVEIFKIPWIKFHKLKDRHLIYDSYCYVKFEYIFVL